MAGKTKKKVIFVTGGSRSGKSSFAQKKAESMEGPLLYVATAEPRDEEMGARIEKHRLARGERWKTLEEPIDLAGAVRRAEGYGCVLIDCLTLWTSNLMESVGRDDAAIEGSFDELAEVLQNPPANVVVVSGEVGLGIVPADPYTRRFRDLAGIANQKIAAASGEAYLVVSGRALRLE